MPAHLTPNPGEDDPNRTLCRCATPMLRCVQLDGEARCAPQQSPVTLAFALNVGFTPKTRLVLVFTEGHYQPIGNTDDQY